MRTSPNIIITGTPGVGKTTHCEQLASSTGLTHLNVNKVVKERDCEDGFDDELNSVIVDEDKASHRMTPLLLQRLSNTWAAPRCY
jgi:adenylate kinase